MISINLSIQQVLHVNPNAIQQNNFTGNLGCAGDTTTFFVYKEAKQTILNFSQETERVFWT